MFLDTKVLTHDTYFLFWPQTPLPGLRFPMSHRPTPILKISCDSHPPMEVSGSCPAASFPLHTLCLSHQPHHGA